MKNLELALANAKLTVIVNYRNMIKHEAGFTAILTVNGTQVAEQVFEEVSDGLELVDWLEAQKVELAFENQLAYIDWLVTNTIACDTFKSYEEAVHFWISQ